MSMSRIVRLALLLTAAPAAMMAQGKVGIDKSLADLEKAAKADPNDAAAHYYVALGYWNEKKWPEVERELKEALALNPRFAPAHLVLYALPYAQRKTLWTESVTAIGIPTSLAEEVAESDRHYRLAFFIDPMVNTAILATIATVDAGTDFGRGVVSCNEGKYADCNAAMVKYFSSRSTAVSRVPKAAYWYHGIAMAQAKDFANAASTWGTISNKPEDDTRKVVAADLARIPIMANDAEMAIGVLQHRYNNNAQNALSIYQRVLATDPTLYLAHTYSAAIYETQQNWEKAIAERLEAMKSNSTDPMLHYEAGLTYAKAGKLAEAVQHLGTATTLMPRNAVAWYQLGNAKELSGDKAGAKDAWNKAVANATLAQAAIQDAAKKKLAAAG